MNCKSTTWVLILTKAQRPKSTSLHNNQTLFQTHNENETSEIVTHFSVLLHELLLNFLSGFLTLLQLLHHASHVHHGSLVVDQATWPTTLLRFPLDLLTGQQDLVTCGCTQRVSVYMDTCSSVTNKLMFSCFMFTGYNARNSKRKCWILEIIMW